MSAFEKSDGPREAIKDDPLPQAGDSLRNRSLDVFLDRVVLWGIIGLIAVLWAAEEWYRLLLNVPVTKISAIIYTVMAAIIAIPVAFKIRSGLRDMEMLRKGRRGELHVGQYLERECRRLGYQVFHDIPCKGANGDFNIDHVLIGPGGVFSLETKNWAKPPMSAGTPTITVSGTKLERSDGAYNNDAIPQSQAIADYLRKEILAGRTGRPVSVIPTIPVLMIPGWFIKDSRPFPKPFWVLGDDTLLGFLMKERRRLGDAEIEALSGSLEGFVRESKKS